MNTDNKREQYTELNCMHMGTDDQGKVKNGKAARLQVIQDGRENDVVFIPAFELDEKSIHPTLLQALKSRGKARKTEYSLERNKLIDIDKNKKEDGHNVR